MVKDGQMAMRKGGRRATMPHEQRDGATHARAAAPQRFPSMYQLGLMILADECPPDGSPLA